MATYNYKAGLHNVGSYQVSGIPFVSGGITNAPSKTATGVPHEITFPQVTRWIVINNGGGNDDDLEFGLPNTLDIATWNIEWFPKNGNATIERVQTIIQNLDIDLWAIQEIDDTTAFKGMIDAIDGYEYVLMDG